MSEKALSGMHGDHDGSRQGGDVPGDGLRVTCALPKNDPVTDALRRLTANWKTIGLYLCAVVAWWVLMGPAGAPLGLPVVIPLPNSCSWASVPTVLLVVPCAAVGVLLLSRHGVGDAPRFLLLAVTVVLPTGLAILSNEVLLDGPEPLADNLPALLVTVAVTLAVGLAVDSDLRHPARVASAAVVLLLLFASLVATTYPRHWWDGWGRAAFDTDEVAGVAASAQDLEIRWDGLEPDSRAELCDRYLAAACAEVGVPKPMLMMEVGPSCAPWLDEGGIATVSMCDVASPYPEAVVSGLDRLVGQMAYGNPRNGDPLWMFSSDDPTVSSWARSAEGSAYAAELGPVVKYDRRETYADMVASLLAYVRTSGSGGGGNEAAEA